MAFDAKTAASKLEGGYDPTRVESAWYKIWREKGYFHADESDEKKEPFTIVIPPPNVTGTLHMGHALFVTLQDVLIRYKKMKGFNALWMPGTDHAGIATQMVVERELWYKEQKTRFELGREEFVKRIWRWKEEKGGRITEQLKVMGAALDWERERFTMDAGLSRAVREVFVTLYEQGLIYRAQRLINWCPRCHTALSDLEVEHKENVPGEMWSFAYPLADGSGEIVVSTTRPETMLGDSAVAVHPEDERYKDIVGKMLKHPLLGYEFPVVGDDVLVDPKFGTGAVKVTPAHDPNDFECGVRHNLKMINILTPDGTLNENCGKYKGLDRFEARRVVKEDLTNMGLFRGTNDHVMSIGACQRCETIVEPYLSMQWYVRTKPLAEKAIEAVRTGETQFIPKSWEKTYYEWMLNIRDWCISRQLWWGHQIPAWYCADCGEMIVARDNPTACPKCGKANLKQDDDVLDTWFSSALWPFSTMGWPDKTKTLERFYPTTVMETGFDIIFFWVCRMMMMGIHFMGKTPFKYVYLHAMVRDHEGEKMSKVKGNVIDPLDVIYGIPLDDLLAKRMNDVKSLGKDDKTAKKIADATKKMFPKGMPASGADALRYTLTSMAGQGRDIRLDVRRIEGYRFFCNKIWNATRFALLNLEGFEPVKRMTAEELLALDLSLADKWALTRLSQVSAQMTTALDNFEFDEACRIVYGFFWGELCDWYIELAKPAMNGTDENARKAARTVLVHALDAALRMLHPFMPFVTEELWQILPLERGVESIMIDAYPERDEKLENPQAATRMELVMEVIKAARTIRGESRIEPQKILPQIVVKTDSEEAIDDLNRFGYYVRALAKVNEIVAAKEYHREGPIAAAVLKGAELFVPLSGVIDVASEIARIEKDMEKCRKDMEKSSARLADESFAQRAPAEVVEKERIFNKENAEKIEKMKESLALLRG